MSLAQLLGGKPGCLQGVCGGMGLCRAVPAVCQEKGGTAQAQPQCAHAGRALAGSVAGPEAVLTLQQEFGKSVAT